MLTEHLRGRTHHKRLGKIENVFAYGVDYVLCDPERFIAPPFLSRNRFNLWSIHDRHHGGPRGRGRGAPWFRALLAERGLPLVGTRLLLLTQPSFLGFHFNPVSFWIALRQGRPCAFVAEVNNTFGQRHCYFCAHPDFRPIEGSDRLQARKLLHVSPFQKVEGSYSFRFDLTDRAVSIVIFYKNGTEGVIATLEGRRRPATSASLIWAALRRPFGAARVLTLIYWQAAKLTWKRAPFLKAQEPPRALVSDGKADWGQDD